MPFIRTCGYCNKKFIKSTYEMFTHVQSCSKYKELIKTPNSNNNSNSNKTNFLEKLKTNPQYPS